MTQVDFYDKAQIDAMNIGKETDTASASGSLWARIKNALSRIGILETADTNNVKKTGTSIVTGTIEVPTIPSTPSSVVNKEYVNDPTDGVNDILHKQGVEAKFKRLIDEEDFAVRTQFVYPPDSTKYVSGYVFLDKNSVPIGNMNLISKSNGVTEIYLMVKNSDGTFKSQVLLSGDVI